MSPGRFIPFYESTSSVATELNYPVIELSYFCGGTMHTLACWRDEKLLMTIWWRTFDALSHLKSTNIMCRVKPTMNWYTYSTSIVCVFKTWSILFICTVDQHCCHIPSPQSQSSSKLQTQLHFPGSWTKYGVTQLFIGYSLCPPACRGWLAVSHMTIYPGHLGRSPLAGTHL